MGTSKSYSASITGQPQWGRLSGDISRNCVTEEIPEENLNKILSRYVGVIGGASNAGQGNSKIAGRAGIRTAKNISLFFKTLKKPGGNIHKAFGAIGITGIDGKPINDVVNSLLEKFSGPAATIDDVAAKAACNKILEELAANVESVEQLEERLNEQLSDLGLDEILIRYYGYYILEHLSIMFYEKLVVEKGKTKCDGLFRQIRDYIFEKLSQMHKTNRLDNLNWNSSQVEGLIKDIQVEVLKIFEGYED